MFEQVMVAVAVALILLVIRASLPELLREVGRLIFWVADSIERGMKDLE